MCFLFRPKKSAIDDILSSQPADRYLVVGLGNPGRRYRHTRHNFGFRVVETFGQRYQTRRRVEPLAEVNWLRRDDRWIILARPRTYMNRSGLAVRELVDHYQIDLDRMLIVTDDLDLPLGRIRLRGHGGSGGHRGMESIIEHLDSDRFPRLRGGIGSCPNDRETADFVLSRFAPDEAPLMDQAVQRATEAVGTFIELGIAQTMNRFNSSE
ncbi:aminoacyl-tRNA hydrolase [candidate division KSB1 bacterium]|nr:aminoacyl-tRNA hydrolase [candidate division KSB1 bacterium]